MKPGPEIGGSLHAIRVLILRLWVDPAKPEALRGTLQSVPEGDAQSFVGDEELLTALHRLARRMGDDRLPGGDETEA